jgi:hypothetical protein
MGCDYYIRSELVIEYIDKNGSKSVTKTTIMFEKGYIFSIPDEDSDDDEETQHNKWKAELQRRIEKNIYKKMLYLDDQWLKYSYQKKYATELNIMCPNMVKLVKVYKDYNAWERD